MDAYLCWRQCVQPSTEDHWPNLLWPRWFILDFVATWNEYAMATTLLRSQSNWTVPLAVQSFSTQWGTEYGPLNAFIIMSAIPVLVVYLMFQRYFVSGALSGAVKG